MSDDGDGGALVVLDPSRVQKRRGVPKGVNTGGGHGITKYTPALAQEVCVTMVTSRYGIGTLCAEMPGWPSFVTIYNWRKQYPDFDKAYVLAQKMRAEYLMARITEIAEDASRDLIMGPDKILIPNAAAVARSKVAAEYLERVAKRLDPQRWGDKLDVNATVGYLPQDEAIRYLK